MNGYLIRWLLGVTMATALGLGGWQLNTISANLLRLDGKIESIRVELQGIAEQRQKGYERLSTVESEVRELKRRLDKSGW